ncbi:hypothetical protein MPTK1_8g02770 [Marchantia polymorpha subsp. ruderalis]|uniref:Carbonic anhydrase n=1 Tax=Marchantia polymorpha TaxID=3197 RepID=A0A2R6XJ29_MARPO|nr:hypothetical protein MARPO_0012s0070 [Marchantia polymorpha]BBN18468.1 hypothetical protein Mp_8g02770 [Marchantia polymorpha subsp. ruderalis]|eukprot:PTQ46113.1 hypothetical protein MARPO_0012s0070 [Marchantia polymorpha]
MPHVHRRPKMSISRCALLCLSALLALSSTASAAENGFEYGSGLRGPAEWGGFCANGTKQSPINVVIADTVLDKSLRDRLDTEYGKCTYAVIINDKSAHHLDVEGDGSFGNLTLNGVKYELVKFHFHSPSEHTIDGVSFDLEMHLFHKSADGKFAVIAIFFNESHDDDAESPFLKQVFSWLPNITQPDTNVTTMAPITLESLPLQGSYAQYSGSLTTPPCTEGVSWVVMLNETQKMSCPQFGAYQKVFPEANNRPVQNTRCRSVTRFEHA